MRSGDGIRNGSGAASLSGIPSAPCAAQSSAGQAVGIRRPEGVIEARYTPGYTPEMNAIRYAETMRRGTQGLAAEL